MRTEEIKKEVLEAASGDIKAALAAEVYDYYFCAENGNQYDDCPDPLCAKRDTVVEQFPQTADWPIVEPIVGEYSDRFGCFLGNGVYLFPDFDFDKPAFTAI